MAVFIGLVFVAYVYVWRKGGLDWSVVDPVEESAVIARDRSPNSEHLEVVGAR